MGLYKEKPGIKMSQSQKFAEIKRERNKNKTQINRADKKIINNEGWVHGREKADKKANFGKGKTLFKLSVNLGVQLNNITDIKHMKELWQMGSSFTI